MQGINYCQHVKQIHLLKEIKLHKAYCAISKHFFISTETEQQQANCKVRLKGMKMVFITLLQNDFSAILNLLLWVNFLNA